MGARRSASKLGLFWCREPELKTELAAHRHHELSPHLGGSTRGKVLFVAGRLPTDSRVAEAIDAGGP
jgi:hypothetical protein